MEVGVRLTVVGSQSEADVICSLLRSHGIGCGERAAEGEGTFGGWREVLVGPSQLASARELLASPPDPQDG